MDSNKFISSTNISKRFFFNNSIIERFYIIAGVIYRYRIGRLHAAKSFSSLGLGYATSFVIQLINNNIYNYHFISAD